MGTIADKMKYLLNTKKLIRKSIISKGIDVGEEDTFRSYADKINLLNKSYGGKYNISQKINDDDTCDLIISNALSGSEDVRTGKYVCRVIDYDGTILKEQYLDTGDVFVLPEIPTHEGLVAQGYSSPVEIIDNQVVVDNSDLIFGIIYTTESGLSEFDIELTKVTGLDVALKMDGIKDWGDGTSNTETTHTYSSYGNYTIKCDGATMTTSSTIGGLFGQTSSNGNWYVKQVRLSNINNLTERCFYQCYSLNYITMSLDIINIDYQSFAYCYSLLNIILPFNLIYIDSSAFDYCYSLQNLVIPMNISKIGCSSCISLNNITLPIGTEGVVSFAFNSCYSIKKVTIPDGATYISQNAFGGCGALNEIIIPDTVTNILNDSFTGCGSIKNIILPAGLARIGRGSFFNCSSITKYDFSKCTSITTLGSTDVFSGINKTAKIIVPDNLYDNWILATNWSSYADYIYKASEVL